MGPHANEQGCCKRHVSSSSPQTDVTSRRPSWPWPLSPALSRSPITGCSLLVPTRGPSSSARPWNAPFFGVPYWTIFSRHLYLGDLVYCQACTTGECPPSVLSPARTCPLNFNPTCRMAHSSLSPGHPTPTSNSHG